MSRAHLPRGGRGGPGPGGQAGGRASANGRRPARATAGPGGPGRPSRLAEGLAHHPGQPRPASCPESSGRGLRSRPVSGVRPSWGRRSGDRRDPEAWPASPTKPALQTPFLGGSLLRDAVPATTPCPLVSATCLRILESPPYSPPSPISSHQPRSPNPPDHCPSA